VKPKWIQTRIDEAIAMLEKAGLELNLGGRLRVAGEGLNSVITGSRENTRTFVAQLIQFDEVFKDTDFKFVDNMPLDRAFKDLKILPVKELVF